MAPERACSATTADGAPCAAPSNLVDPETGLCPAHAPGASERLAEIGRKGAEAAARRLRRPGLDPEDLPTLEGPQDAAHWLEVIGRAVAEGRLGHREATAATRTVEAWLKAHDAGAVTDRIKELTDALAEWRRTGDPEPVLRLVPKR